MYLNQLLKQKKKNILRYFKINIKEILEEN